MTQAKIKTVQQEEARQPVASASTPGVVARSPGADKLAQLAAMMRNSPRHAAQRKRADMLACSPVSKPVAQLLLDGQEKNEKIKIWNAEEKEVEEVYLFEEEDGIVYYSETKITGKTKRKDMSHIAEKLAFPIKFSNSQIKKEIGLEEEAAALSEQGVNIPADVIAFLMQELQPGEETKNEALDVQLNPARIALAFNQCESLMSMFGDKEFTLAEFRESYDADPGYRDELLDLVGRTGTRTDPGRAGGDSGEGGGGGHEDWKTDRTSKDKRDVLARIAGEALFALVSERSTLHHKFSRSHMKRMLTLLTGTPSSQAGVSAMYQFIDAVKILSHSGDPQTALDNWVANIELGVFANDRTEGDDPGEEFDGSYLGGIATPRTEQLQQAEALVMSARSGPEVDWVKVAQYLNETQAQHVLMTKNAKLKSDQLTNPRLEQWHEEEKGEYSREKPRSASSSSSSSSSTSSSSSGTKSK